MKKILLPFIFLVFCGCDDALECGFTNRNADMQDKPVQILTRDVFASIVYEAEVTNDIADDEDYEYTFDLFGDVPPGMTVTYENRQVVLRGYPQRAGVYDFSIRVFVDYVGFDFKCLNDDSDENSYRITVQ